VFSEPRVASVGTTRGDHVVMAVQRIEWRRSTYERRSNRPGLLTAAAGTNESVIVGAIALGPDAGE
jgi:pyruvate/2-oxoglutarate dehydrogenase complex dihydrolipoamide dehydrogenase (E3) component